MFKPFLKKLLKTLLIAAPLALLLSVIVTKFGGGHLLAHALPPIPTIDNQELSDLTKSVIEIQKVLNYLLWPVLALIGSLMQNDLFFGGGMAVRLQEIWINIRNVVNIFFVIILVGIALYNVLGIGEDSGSYAIKTILPKIIIGIIVINFSFLAAKVMLDAINVITTSIFAIPTQISEAASDGVKEGQIGYTETEASLCGGIPFFEYLADAPANIYCDGDKLSDNGKLYLAKYGMNNAAMLLAIKGGKVQFYDTLLKGTDAGTISISVFFSLLMYFIYAISFIALVVVLFARVVVLWLGIALSPIILLAMAVPDFKSKVGGLNELVDTIIKTAIAPIMIALSLTVGWIMLGAFQGVEFIQGLKMETRIPVQPLSDFQNIISAIGVVAIVWMGVFTAAGGTVAKGVTDKLRGAAAATGTFLATAPFKYWPIIPANLMGAHGAAHDTDGSGHLNFNEIINMGKNMLHGVDKSNKGGAQYTDNGDAIMRSNRGQAKSEEFASTLTYTGANGTKIDRFRDEATLQGSPLHKDLSKLYKGVENYTKKLEELRKAQASGETEKIKTIGENLAKQVQNARLAPEKPASAQPAAEGVKPAATAATETPASKATLKDGLGDVLADENVQKKLKTIIGEKEVANTDELKGIHDELVKGLEEKKITAPETGLGMDKEQVIDTLGKKQYEKSVDAMKKIMKEEKPGETITDDEVEQRIRSLVNTGKEPVTPTTTAETKKPLIPPK